MTGFRTKINGNHGKYMIVLYTKPEDCGGNCLYCIKSDAVTRSTILNEDTLLAKDSNWSSFFQFQQRCVDAGLQMNIGNKFELRIKGNSFTNYPFDYLENFIKDVYDFLNGYVGETLEQSFRLQENAKDKCVQIVVETRPDQITEEWCEKMLKWGVRTVEIGVQSLNDSVLDANNRGHHIDEVIRASTLIRKYGFELGYQVMLGLWQSSKQIDYDMLTKGLWQEDLYPDSLKIYPCLLLPDERAQGPLYKLFNEGKWMPINDDDYIEFLNEVLPHIPRDVHINRLQRIFREDEVAYGPKKIINRERFAKISKCMWQRSVQNNNYNLMSDFSNYSILATRHGNEVCVQAVLPDDTLLGYARLSIKDSYTLIRDLRTLGIPRNVGDHNNEKKGVQHIGIGKSMLYYMEQYTLSLNMHIIKLHTSAGCIGYFKSVGYSSENYYTLSKVI